MYIKEIGDLSFLYQNFIFQINGGKRFIYILIMDDVLNRFQVRFIPNGHDTPLTLFRSRYKSIGGMIQRRFVGRGSNNRTELIYVDGACLNNGRQYARAGYGIFLSPSN